MKTNLLKRDVRLESRLDRTLNIQTYGETNDYPQRLSEIVDASGSGSQCVDIYAKFINGQGFADSNFYRMIVNRKGETNDKILQKITKDHARYGGFAIHVNYNANLKITEIQHVPFETCRWERPNDEGYYNKILTHPDWGKRNTNIRAFKKEDIKEYNSFNPETVLFEVEQADGWLNYKGQILYYSNNGEKTYPLPMYDAVLTDMNTEEGLANVNNRNARNNFLVSGMFIDKMNIDTTEQQAEETRENLRDFQGDEKTGQIMYIQIKSDEEKPEFVPFQTNNYDKAFEVTKTTIQQNIGKAFSIPPILRSESISSNFGADLMKNAYNFYNSVTDNERQIITRVYNEIFVLWKNTITFDAEILPLSYNVEMTIADKLGKDGLSTATTIVQDVTLTTEQKRAYIGNMFALTEKEINTLIV